MPFAQIYLMEGRTDEQKKLVIEKVTQALNEAIDAPMHTIRVCLVEVPSANWGIAGVPAAELKR
jgi:4-oxalocrotonate tautomerase